MNPPINNFNWIAGLYDVLSFIVFRNVLKKSQLYFIHQIPPDAHVLIVGGGTGWYLHKLLKSIPCKKIDYVDASAEMMRLSRKRIAALPYTAEIKFIEGKVEDIALDEKYDIIVTHYVLDLFKEEKLKIVMKKLYGHLKKEGLWLFTDFKINNNPCHRYWQKGLARSMYIFFRVSSRIENDRLLPFNKYFKELKLENTLCKSFFSGMMESIVYKK